MSNDWVGTGYNAETGGSDNSLFFRLKTKGETARLRLVSEACRYMDKYDPQDGSDIKEVKRVAWVAILKEMVGGKAQKRVVVFQSGPQVYGAVKNLLDTEEWGDPTLYDITVTRTEELPNFYAVTPLPKPMGPITEEEAALVAEADIHLDAIIKKRMEKAGYKFPPASAGETDDPFADDL